ncbi:MAG: TIGR00730 family Rossman fold protein [Candidatus Pacebacteria bacterium]|nr:TIGR00730 family Rossman fold protein [Candidatus Paceibacterota bacterium]MCF7857114.1 TIGR00730 family Rossman fold protein [Candidatus Paceibacterota bacterium]
MTTFRKKSESKKKDSFVKDRENDHCRVLSDLFETDDAIQSWRIFRIMSEFVDGFEILRKYGTAATFFGSARFSPRDPYYKTAELLASKLAKKGFAIITGGGPGIMEAANVGSFKVGGKSVGLNIQLPMEQKLNPYVTESESFHYFFSRKVMLSFASEVYIYFPGGFGTLDEFLEIITLIQTRKISRIPIVLYGKEYWSPLIEFFKKSLLQKYSAIDKEDLDLFHLVDSVDEAYEYILKNVDMKSQRQM